jgi:hypothetical protein
VQIEHSLTYSLLSLLLPIELRVLKLPLALLELLLALELSILHRALSLLELGLQLIAPPLKALNRAGCTCRTWRGLGTRWDRRDGRRPLRLHRPARDRGRHDKGQQR